MFGVVLRVNGEVEIENDNQGDLILEPSVTCNRSSARFNALCCRGCLSFKHPVFCSARTLLGRRSGRRRRVWLPGSEAPAVMLLGVRRSGPPCSRTDRTGAARVKMLLRLVWPLRGHGTSLKFEKALRPASPASRHSPRHHPQT